jgi:hypothetical protein
LVSADFWSFDISFTGADGFEATAFTPAGLAGAAGFVDGAGLAAGLAALVVAADLAGVAGAAKRSMSWLLLLTAAGNWKAFAGS